MMKKRYLCFVLCLCVFFTQTMATASDQQQETLRQVIQDMMIVYEQKAGMPLEWDGETTIEPGDGYYAVTLPDLTVQGDNGQSLAVGLIAINAVPVTEYGRDMWSMTVALPTPMFFYQSGDIVGQIQIHDQETAFLWDPLLKLAVQSDLHWQTIRYDDYQEKAVVQLESVTAREGYEPDEEDLWSGDVRFYLSGFTIQQQEALISLGSLKAETQREKINLEKLKDVEDSAADWMEWAAHNPDTFDPLSFLVLLDSANDLVEKETTQYEANNIRLQDQDPNNTVDIPSLKGSVDITEKVDWKLDVPVIQTADPQPGKVFLHAALENWPDVFTPSEKNPIKPFQEAGTLFTLHGMTVDLPPSGFSLKGEAMMDNVSAFGVVARFDLLLNSLEGVFDSFEKYAGEEHQPNPAMKQFFLPLIESLGNHQEVDGKKLYRLEITPDGKMMVNGLSFQELLGGLNLQFSNPQQ